MDINDEAEVHVTVPQQGIGIYSATSTCCDSDFEELKILNNVQRAPTSNQNAAEKLGVGIVFWLLLQS